MYWWDYIAAYPKESAIIIGVIILGYIGYVEISKFWHKPLFITKRGDWRIQRYAGRLIQIGKTKAETRLFRPGLDDNRVIEGIIKIRGQPKRSIMLNTADIISVESRRVVMNKKNLVWNYLNNTYVLIDEPAQAYLVNLQNLEAYYTHRIDTIDIKSNKAAAASPAVIHSSLLQQHLPLDYDSYQEAEPGMVMADKFIFDQTEVGDYGSFSKALDDVRDKKSRPLRRSRRMEEELDLDEHKSRRRPGG